MSEDRGHVQRTATTRFRDVHPGFSFLFGTWVLLWIASELFAYPIDHWLERVAGGWLERSFGFPRSSGDGWVRLALMLWLLILALVGLRWGLKKGGRGRGAFSTMLRTVLAKMGPWATISLGGAIGPALGLRIASLPFLLAGYDYAFFTFGPWCLLSAGVAVWLIPHFRVGPPSVGGSR